MSTWCWQLCDFFCVFVVFVFRECNPDFLSAVATAGEKSSDDPTNGSGSADESLQQLTPVDHAQTEDKVGSDSDEHDQVGKVEPRFLFKTEKIKLRYLKRSLKLETKPNLFLICLKRLKKFELFGQISNWWRVVCF
jgi:hypothetical protein